MRTPLIAGNWKLNKTLAEARELATQLRADVAHLTEKEIVIAPTFLALSGVAEIIHGTSIQLAGQNCYPEERGAFTGEISPLFLRDAGCQYVIIGHSERRQYLNETDDFIRRKVVKAIETGIKPILCIGETLEQREKNHTFDILFQQIKGALESLPDEQMATVVIAYEPVWAIGTGKTASTDQAQEVHSFIRKRLAEMFNSEIAEATRILYGGSVKPDNVDDLMAEKDIDGALVGGASLNADEFIRIIRYND